MKWFCLIAIVSIALVGCGKKNAGPPSPASQLTNAPQTTESAKALEGVPDPELTVALRAFAREKGRLPQSMFELKAAKLDSMPRPPAGFTYAIDPVTIEVKVVKQ